MFSKSLIKSFTEVNYIVLNLDEKDRLKISPKFLKILNKYSDDSIEINIDLNKSFKEQNLSKYTKLMIRILNLYVE